MSNTEEDIKYQLTLTQNELDKTNHFVDLLRDQVAELKLTIESKNTAITEWQKDYLELKTQIDLSVADHNHYVNLNVSLSSQLANQADRMEMDKETIGLQKQGILKLERNIRDLEKKLNYCRNVCNSYVKEKKNYLVDIAGQKRDILCINTVVNLLLKYTEYLQWYYSKQIQSLEQLTEESTKHVAALRNALHDKDYALENATRLQANVLRETLITKDDELEKANRRWTDLQTANCTLIAENKILRKKLDLMDFILGGAGLSKSGDQIIDTGLNSTPKIQAFVELLNFDKQPENQIDTVLTSLPSYSDLEKQVADLKENLDKATNIKELQSISELLRKYEAAQLDNGQLVAENKLLVEKCEQSRKELLEIAVRNEILRNENKKVKDLSQQLFFSREENQRLSDKCNSLIQENSVYKLRPSVEMFSNEHLIGLEIEQLKEENKTLTNQNDGLRKQNRQLKRRVKTELNYEREWQILSKENKSLKRDITVSEEKSIKLNKDLDDQRISFKSKIVELQNENKELKDQIDLLEGRQNGYSILIDQQTKEIGELKEKLENLQKVRNIQDSTIYQLKQLKNLVDNEDSTRIKELKDINHTLTNTLSNVETQRDTAIRASEYHASKLKLADKILYGTGILTMSYECLKQLPKVVHVNELMKIIKEYITFEHRKEESK